MDTDTLKLFVAAAERLNISAAGRALGLAPAMASARLAKLEREIGAELLHRTTRKVSLSQEGEALLPYAREILAQSEAAYAAMGLGGDTPSGTLRFTAPSTFAQLHIMPLLPKFHAAWPEITLDLRLSDMRFDLIEGSFDLALRSAPLEDSSLRGRKLADDHRLLCAAPEYLAQHGVPRTPDDLAGLDFLPWGNLAPRAMVHRDGQSALLDPAQMRCRAIFQDGASQRVATCAGAGLSFNPIWSVSDDLSAGRLVQVLPGWRLDDAAVLWLIYPRSNVLTPKVRCFMDFLLDELRPKLVRAE